MESEKRPGGQRDTGRGTAPRKAVFLDRDGTMNTEVNYLHNPGDLELIPGTAEAVKLLNEAGFAVIVVTNQAGVARGYYTEADVEAVIHCAAYTAVDAAEDNGGRCGCILLLPPSPGAWYRQI